MWPFKRLPKPTTPPGTPAWTTTSLPTQRQSQAPAPLDPGIAEPENLLAYGSIGTLGLLATFAALGSLVSTVPAVMSTVAILYKILQLGGWAATIGIGVSSRFKVFRLMGWCTAASVAGIYLWKRVSGLPPYSFFGLAGALSIAMIAGNLLAWWFARKRHDGA